MQKSNTSRNSVETTLELVLLILLCSCNAERADLAGHYFERESSIFNAGNIVVEDLRSNSSMDHIFTDASFIDFYRNGTYNLQLAQYEYGDYKIDGDTIRLTSSTGEQKTMTYEHLTENKTLLKSFTPQGRPVEYRLDRTENSRSDSYPFSIENNTWRIPQEYELMHNERIDLLQNHITFYQKYLLWCIDQDLPVRASNLPTPFRLRGRSIGVRRSDRMGSWCRIFQGDDCIKLHNLLFSYFKSGKYKQRNYATHAKWINNAFDQISKGLDEQRQAE